MPATPEDITTLVERDLATIPDARLAQFIRGRLLKPTAVARAWNYGEPGLTYVCWIVLQHEQADTGVAYYEFRRPRANPWRTVRVSCPELAAPADPGWRASLLEAFVKSRPDTELPAPGLPVTGLPQPTLAANRTPDDGIPPNTRSRGRSSP